MSGHDLVVGASGLVGSAILRSLHGAIPARIDWPTGASIASDLGLALDRLLGIPANDDRGRRIFWAAGRSVISSTDAEVDAELAHFRAALEVIAERATERLTLVLISSAGALHPGTKGPAITESTPPRPTSAYGRMKFEQERLVAAACAASGMRGLILRAPTVYGPHQDPTKRQGLVSALVRSACTGSPVTIYVPRDARRHHLWSDDLGRMATEAVLRIPLMPGATETRHVVTERSRTIDEVVATVTRAARRRPVVRFMATNHAPGHGVDLTLRSEFDPAWRTSGTVGLAEGVRRLLDHRRSGRDRSRAVPDASSSATRTGPLSMPHRSASEASRVGTPRGSSDTAT